MKSNDQLQLDVMAELKWDPPLSNIHTEIGVAVKDGTVMLTGVVPTYQQKVAAAKAAQRVQGVKSVSSEIVVQSVPHHHITDTEIALAVKNALRWNTAVEEGKLEVKVDNGWVTLEGEAEWEYQKTSAQSSVENLLGVTGVTNHIKLRIKTVDAQKIKDEITAAFVRNAQVDSNSVRLDVSGNRVTLYGTVRSWVEKEQVEQIAWSSPGVLVVDNRLDIDAEVCLT